MATKTTLSVAAITQVPTDSNNPAPTPVDIWEGVPVALKEDPSYFRNLDPNEWIMIVQKAKSTLSNTDPIFISKKNFESQQGKPEPKYQMVKITGPPCRVKWANLHATGDYPGIPKQTLTNANFGVVFYEGNIPDDLKAKFPAIEREQKAFFDFCENIQKLGVEKMWNNAELRKKEKEAAEETAVGFLGTTDKSVLQTPEMQKKLKDGFFKNANQTHKADLVRGPNQYYTQRWIAMKKSVSGELDLSKAQNQKPRYERTGKEFNGKKHYIDSLLEVTPKPREYRPPTILNSAGAPLDLGLNEKQVIFNNDICIPSFFPKIYDAKDYGVRALYCCLQFVRVVRADEIDNGGMDVSVFADDIDDSEIMNRGTKRPADDEEGSKKKKKIEIVDPNAPQTAKQDAVDPIAQAREEAMKRAAEEAME